MSRGRIQGEFNKSISFHQHNGKTTVTAFLFINIMERLISDIFDACVFNNIMEDTFIFPPRVFSLACHEDSPNYLIFNDMDLCEIFAVYR